MAADLDELEDKLMAMFNARYQFGKKSDYGASEDKYALHAMAAADCADMILRIHQQKHLEEGNGHLVPQNNNPRTLRRYVQQKKK